MLQILRWGLAAWFSLTSFHQIKESTFNGNRLCVFCYFVTVKSYFKQLHYFILVVSLESRPILIIKQCFTPLSGIQQLNTSFPCDLFTRPASSLCSVVNKMFALKGENNCKYKHGELHLGLEQTCISDSSDSHLRGETDPQITVRSATHRLMLSLTSTHTHTYS